MSGESKSPKQDFQSATANERHRNQARPSLRPPTSTQGLSCLQRLFGSHCVESPPTLMSWLNHVTLWPKDSCVLSPQQPTQFRSLWATLYQGIHRVFEIAPLFWSEHNDLGKTLLPVRFSFFSTGVHILLSQGAVCSTSSFIQKQTDSTSALWVYQNSHRKICKHRNSPSVLPSAVAPFLSPVRFTVSQVLFNTEKRTSEY